MPGPAKCIVTGLQPVRATTNQYLTDMKTIEEGNKLIAEFMGAKYHTDSNLPYYSLELGDDEWYFTLGEDEKFHESWDWLMPVVERIETIEHGGYSLRFDIQGEVCTVNDINGNFIEVSGATKIDGAWRCVIEFIEWYNENK